MGQTRRAWAMLLVSAAMVTTVAVWTAAQPSERTVKIGLFARSNPATSSDGEMRRAAELAVLEEGEALQRLGVRVELLALEESAEAWAPSKFAQEGVAFVVFGHVSPPLLHRLADEVSAANTAVVTLASERASTDEP